ncbi:hypothetical protein KSS87_022315 [Heliosperma pusillum]|nr:hypothetical protein KSS87_022315 [Heliosperma pusillum]
MEVPLGGLEREKSSSTAASPVSAVANFWKDFELEKEKSLLDEQGLRIAENQENSQKNRRKLAESTRDFKKAPPEDKLNLFNALLKGYQEEVDNLTKRAKFGENAFLNIYQKLYEAPDPYPVIVSISEQDVQISELETENRKMKVELEEFRAEAAHLKNQQATIRRLEERNRQLELQMEEKVKEIVEIKQRGLAEENQKILEVLKEREQSLQDQLRQAKESVTTMQKLHELAQSQLFELRAQSDEERAAKQSELGLLLDEVERAQSRLLSIEREKGHLRSQLQSANEESTNKKSSLTMSWNMRKTKVAHTFLTRGSFRSYKRSAALRGSNPSGSRLDLTPSGNKLVFQNHVVISNVVGSLYQIAFTFSNCGSGPKLHDTEDSSSILENSLSAKEKIISELNMELHNVETTLSEEREQHITEIKKLNALLHEKEISVQDLKKELQARPTTKLVEDLRKKVKILQAVGYNSIEAEDWEVATTGEEMSKLESLLLDKNRKMEHELTQLKVKLSEKTSLLEAAESKESELTSTIDEQQKLIQKLEDDILKGYSSKERRTSLFNDWDLSESVSADTSEGMEQKHVPGDQDQSSMLKVICNQRDRFRARLRETEEEVRQLKDKVRGLTDELEKTKADNVKLYGKMRYVQDYNREKVVSRGSKRTPDDLESGFSSDVETKYKKIYEEDINPFAAFSKKERDQRYKELGLRDKITLTSGRFLLGNKMSALSHLRYPLSVAYNVVPTGVLS